MEKELPPFQFNVIRILDCGFMFQELVDPNPTKLVVGYGMNFGFNIEGNWIEYGIRADFKQSDSAEAIISGTALTRFNVHNMVAFYNTENDQMEFPIGALETLFGMSFTHLRALLSKNLAGTKFSNIYLPVINPEEVFKDLLGKNMENFHKSQQKSQLKKKTSIKM